MCEVPNFTIVALEMWVQVCQNHQNMEFFCTNLPLKGQSS